jgi:acetate kinase
VMATRSGTVDPGLVLWLAEHAGLTVASIADALEHHAGLLGLTGTPDMQDVLARYQNGDELAELAVGIYVHRLRAGIASMVAARGGVDAIAFTGGVGERAPEIRALAIRGLDFLGVTLGQPVNERSAADTDVSAATSRVHVVVIEAGEDLQVANDVEALLAGVHPSP